MEEINLRLLLVGDSSVGKTSLLYQYAGKAYPRDHIATVGVEYIIKMFQYRDFQIRLQIWDTAGQERFHSLTKNFFHNADGILFVYDITNQRSFRGAKNWIWEAKEIENFFQKILIGNKLDLEEQREVSIEELDKYCKEEKIEYFETSVKNNINIKEAFNKIVELIFKDKSDEEIINEFGMNNSSLSITSYNSIEKNKKKK